MSNVECKICSKPVYGRSDKQFCSVYCKNQYHIRARKSLKSASSKIDAYLHLNYSILQELLVGKKKQTKINKEILSSKQFRFKYHTHTNNSKTGLNYMIYDLSWRESGKGSITISRNS